jgi:2-amino-4-hydroxy-6-hydroxymethyldihydropteridine diphosphokinase
MRRFPASWATWSSRCTTLGEGRAAPVAFVALGANLGDRAATFGRALGALAALGSVEAASRVWTTAPVGGPPGQPDYLNAVVRWRPAHAWSTPARALAALLAIEAGSGRRRRERWGPRTLDLDLLDGAGWSPAVRAGSGPGPTLPHPRAAERAFVLVPWAEVAPDWPAPGHGAATVADLARAVGRAGVRLAAGAEAAGWSAAVSAARHAPSAEDALRGRG